jgi:hypothetical protein
MIPPMRPQKEHVLCPLTSLQNILSNALEVHLLSRIGPLMLLEKLAIVALHVYVRGGLYRCMFVLYHGTYLLKISSFLLPAYLEKTLYQRPKNESMSNASTS